MATGAIEVLSQAHPNSKEKNDGLDTYQFLLDKLNNDLAISKLDSDISASTHHSLSKLFRGPEYQILFASVHGLSDLFEVYCINQRKLATANVQQADKSTTTSDQASFSQIYTPPLVVHSIIECLLQPLLDRADSIEAIKAISMLDPCCGTGNFLTAAASAFYKTYEQFDLPQAEIWRLILEHNIFGLDIDARALVIAEFALTVSLMTLSCGNFNGRRNSPSKISCLHNTYDVAEAALGSLSPKWKRTAGHPLNRKYTVVVTNPPYLGRKLIDRALKQKLKKYYPECASDLSQIFLWKALDLATDGGGIGFLTQSSFMHLPSSLALRKRILEEAQINLVIELGDGVFPLLAGSKADSSIIILTKHKAKADEPAYYLDLRQANESDVKAKTKERRNGHLNQLSQLKHLAKYSKSHGELSLSSDLAFNFKRPRALFLVQARDNQALASKADFKQGLATSSNERFLRYAWEVEEDDRSYVPYAKGGGSERWWRTISSKVRWGENGEEIKSAVAEAYPYLKGQVHWVVKNESYYFKPGLTFSFVNKHRLSVRRLPPGAIFDVGGSAIFSHESGQENLLLAYLNSGFVSALAHDLNPTINFQIGDLKRLPLLQFASPLAQNLATLASDAVDLKQELEPLISPQAALLAPSIKYTSLSQEGFESHLRAVNNYQHKLLAIEEEIDSLVLAAAQSHFALDAKDQLEISLWVEERAKADTSAAAAIKITSKNFFENQLAQAFANRLWRSKDQLDLCKRITSGDVSNFLKNNSRTELDLEVELDPNFVNQFTEGDLNRYFSGRFNQVMHEQFGGQPPVLSVNSAVQATLPLAKASKCRPADLYRSLLD